MRSWERPSKSSARVFFPSSVSKTYSFSIRTHGSSCRWRASSSLRRVSSFSAASSSSRAASHSSRVPFLSLFIGSFPSVATSSSSSAPDSHLLRETGNRRGRENDEDSQGDDREPQRRVDRGSRRQELLAEDEDGDDGHRDEAHDAQCQQHHHQADARADAREPEPHSRADVLAAAPPEV